MHNLHCGSGAIPKARRFDKISLAVASCIIAVRAHEFRNQANLVISHSKSNSHYLYRLIWKLRFSFYFKHLTLM
jgi:hypothetical protein